MNVNYNKLLERLREKKKSYQSLFGSNGLLEGDALRDLAWFCCAFQTTAGLTDRDTLLNEGRRQVWLRIQEYMQFEPGELAQLYGSAIRKGDG